MRNAIFLLILVAVFTISNAEENNSPVESVSVTGSRIEPATPLSVTLSAEELKGVAGGGDDALQTILTLPGVSISDDSDTGAAVRGTRPGDNQTIVDFLPVGYLYHLNGYSVVDGNLVDNFHFYPAAYGAVYSGNVGAAPRALQKSSQAFLSI